MKTINHKNGAYAPREEWTDMTDMYNERRDDVHGRSRWDTRALESADRMFFCLVKFNRDLSRWDTRRLRRATQVFFGCPIAEAHKPRVPDDRPDFRFVGGQYV